MIALSPLDMLALTFATVISAGICFSARSVATRLGVLDEPGGRKTHARATPLIGGIVLLAALLPAWTAWTIVVAPPHAASLLWIAITTAALTILGLIDDRGGVCAMKRLIASTIVVGVAIAAEPALAINVLRGSVDAVSLGLKGFGGVFTVVALIALQNAINMADGKNGLVLGMSLSWCVILGWYAPPDLAPPLLLAAAALAVLLCFNLKGLLFLGDGGTYGLAALIGMLGILVYADGAASIAGDTLGLLFAIPTMDMIRLMVIRVMRGRSPFAPDRDHLHHHLLSAFGWPAGLLLYWALALLPSIVAMLAPQLTLVWIALGLTAYWIAILATTGSRVTSSATSRREDNGASVEEGDNGSAARAAEELAELREGA